MNNYKFKLSPINIAFLVVFLILLIDQLIKFWIKTNMIIGESFPVFGNWFLIHFTENEGMAFGMTLGGVVGKYLLTIIRIAAVVGIGWYLNSLIKAHNATRGVVIGISFVLAGALGNIFDSVFYGVLFSESYGQVAQLFPEAGGYAPWFQGHVVDMLYFPLIEGHFPSWFPFWSNDHFLFFRPVFNIADSAITCGVVYLVLFQGKYFKALEKKKENNS
ncbi:MAG: lipoprotein signal peptidase [Salinivirgaceae bacterium]|nr:lipoprotein signal peptidase [Salinivirgaceae bacterium]MDD4746753.1 lipoprotein signal peptidase [Salinivirgaceae bacterium]MDY0281996.1 lipoprotein signal peptidase [Salinivirgaceae bacterium]